MGRTEQAKTERKDRTRLRVLTKDTLPRVALELNLVSKAGEPTRFRRAERTGPAVVEVMFTPAFGKTVADHRKHASAFEAVLGAHRVFVDEISPGTGRLVILDRDPWPKIMPWIWPEDPWAGFAVATDLRGRTISTGPVGAHWLAGGMTRSGKSSLLRTLTAGGAVAPGHAIVGIDPKGTELDEWEPRMSHLVAADPKETLVTLRVVEQFAEAQFARMRSQHIKEVHRPGRGLHTVQVIVDELQAVIDYPKHGADCLDILTRLAYLYTSAGVSVVCAMQKPEANDIGKLRANLGRRACFAVREPNHTQVILGHQEVDAHKLDPRTGLAYLDTEGHKGIPLVKAHYLDADDSVIIAEGTAGLRPSIDVFDELAAAGGANPVILSDEQPEAGQGIGGSTAGGDRVAMAVRILARVAGRDNPDNVTVTGMGAALELAGEALDAAIRQDSDDLRLAVAECTQTITDHYDGEQRR